MALQVLFRLGNPPTTVHAGFRSLLAFWGGGASNSGTAVVLPPDRRPEPPPNSPAGGISPFRSGPRRSRPIYLGWRGLRPDEVTAEDIRETAQEVRNDEQLLTQEIEALEAAVSRFEPIDRLASAAAELRRAIEYAQIKQREDAEDDEIAVMLLTVH